MRPKIVHVFHTSVSLFTKIKPNNLEIFNTFGISCFETNLSYIFLLENSNVPEGSRVPAGCPSATRGSLGPFVAILKLEVIKMCPALSTIGVNA